MRIEYFKSKFIRHFLFDGPNAVSGVPSLRALIDLVRKSHQEEDTDATADCCELQDDIIPVDEDEIRDEPDISDDIF